MTQQELQDRARDPRQHNLGNVGTALLRACGDHSAKPRQLDATAEFAAWAERVKLQPAPGSNLARAWQ